MSRQQNSRYAGKVITAFIGHVGSDTTLYGSRELADAIAQGYDILRVDHVTDKLGLEMLVYILRKDLRGSGAGNDAR